jgi:hypothetical protein
MTKSSIAILSPVSREEDTIFMKTGAFVLKILELNNEE